MQSKDGIMSSTESKENIKEPSPAPVLDDEGPLDNSQPHSQEASPGKGESNEPQSTMRAISIELAQEFGIESLSAVAVKEAQGQIQTVALQMDGVRTQLGQIEDHATEINQQTKALIESTQALDQIYRQIDELAILVDTVAASVRDINGEMEQAERELTSTALQPLQAVLESLKMGPKGFRS